MQIGASVYSKTNDKVGVVPQKLFNHYSVTIKQDVWFIVITNITENITNSLVFKHTITNIYHEKSRHFLSVICNNI